MEEPPGDPDPYSLDVGAIQAAVDAAKSCVRLFVAGAETHVGKTSVCLSLLAALRRAGYEAQDMAYIKPATQCEAPDLLSAWCKKEGVEHIAGDAAPLIFYGGFTRSFLAGEQGSSQYWLERIRSTVDDLAASRKVVLVDGVGYPAVGSIVGADNADVAKVCRAPVLLVCQCGVGNSVDSFSLNSTYFITKGVPVLGAVFNMGKEKGDGAYAWDKCAEAIQKWFALNGRRERYYGAVPKAAALEGLRERISQTAEAELEAHANVNAEHLAKYADLTSIFEDAAGDAWCRHPTQAVPTSTLQAAGGGLKPKSREEVETQAKSQGFQKKRGG